MQRFLIGLGGPIFAKELLEAARRRRYFANRVLYSLALLVVVSIVWQEARYLRQGPFTTYEMARFAHSVFISINVVQYLAVWFFVPVFVCGLISSEREAHTLDLLLTAQMSDREIVLGKLISRWAIVVMILASTLPIVSLLGVFGGVDIRSVWRMLSTTLLAMLFAGAFSIYFSSASRSPVGALVRTYWWLAVFLLGVPMMTIAVLETFRVMPGSQLAILLYGQLFVNPVGSFLVAVDPVGGHRELTSRIGWWYNWPMYGGPALLSAAMLWRAVVRLRLDPSRLLVARLGSWVAHRHFSSLVRWRERRVARRAARAERGFLGLTIRNPIWLRSRLARVYDREGYIGRIQLMGWIAAMGMFLLMLVFNPRDLRHDDGAVGFLIPTWSALGLLVTVIAASAFVSDRRRGFFELVLATTLSAREIVDGTLLAVWHHLRSTWWLAVVLTILFILTGAVHPHCAFVSLVSGTLFAGVLLVTGVTTSLAARSLPQSLVPTFVLSILMTVGTGLMVAAFDDASGPLAWLLAAILWPAAFLWVRKSLSPAAVGTYLIATHLALVLAATAFSFDGENECLPLGLSNPGPMVIGTAVSRNREIATLFVRYDQRHRVDLAPHIAAYWLAMVINIVWARYWLIAHFDRLAGRIEHRVSRQRAVPQQAAEIASPSVVETTA